MVLEFRGVLVSGFQLIVLIGLNSHIFAGVAQLVERPLCKRLLVAKRLIIKQSFRE